MNDVGMFIFAASFVVEKMNTAQDATDILG